MARHHLSNELQDELENDQGATKQQLEDLEHSSERQRIVSLWIVGLILGLAIPLSYLVISWLGAIIGN